MGYAINLTASKIISGSAFIVNKKNMTFRINQSLECSASVQCSDSESEIGKVKKQHRMSKDSIIMEGLK